MLSIRFSGSTISPKRTPKRSPIITTSPLAILVLFTKISKGSPASLSSSTTDPSFNLSKSRIVISVRPTSTVSSTSIFSRTFRFSIPTSFSSVLSTCSFQPFFSPFSDIRFFIEIAAFGPTFPISA